MAKEDTAGLGVKTHYGPRDVPEGNAGVIKTAGAKKQLSIEFTGKNINDGILDSIAVIPSGSRVTAAYYEIEEAFVVTGTSPVLNVGTDGSAATNGVSITEAGLEAVDTYTDGDTEVTINGTFSGAALAADTTVSIELSGTSPAVTDAGKARFVLEYVQV